MAPQFGWGPFAAVQSIAVIDGLRAIWGDGALALVEHSCLIEDRCEDHVDDEEGLTAMRRRQRSGTTRPPSRKRRQKSPNRSVVPPPELLLQIDPSWPQERVFQHYRARLETLGKTSAKPPPLSSSGTPIAPSKRDCAQACRN